MNAPIHFVQDEYSISNINYTAQSLSCHVTDTGNKITESFNLDLNGIYQAKNLCTVLCAEGILMENSFIIKNEEEKAALSNVKGLTGLYGRWDVISRDPTIVLDVAHNEDGIKQLLQQLNAGDRPSVVHFVMGMVKDKDINKVLSLMPKNGKYYFSNAHIPRAMPHQELKQKAAGFGLQGESYDDVNTAIKEAVKNAEESDTIVVCGSVFLVAEVETTLFK